MRLEIRRSALNQAHFFKLFGVLFLLFYGAIYLLQNAIESSLDRVSFVIYIVVIPFFASLGVNYANRRSYMAVSGILDQDRFVQRISNYLINSDYYISPVNSSVYVKGSQRWRRFLEDIDCSVEKVQGAIIISGPPKEIEQIEYLVRTGKEFEEFR